MWTCPYCGNQHGMIFEDSQMTGVLCLHPDCGRMDQQDYQEIRSNPELWAESDF